MFSESVLCFYGGFLLKLKTNMLKIETKSGHKFFFFFVIFFLFRVLDFATVIFITKFFFSFLIFFEF